MRIHIRRRNGTLEPIQFEKVHKRLQLLGSSLRTDDDEPPSKTTETRFRQLDCDFSVVTQQVIARIYDGISTYELDQVAADVSISLLSQHPDYGWLSSRILVTRLHKETKKSVLATFRNLHSHGNLADDVYEVVKKNAKTLEAMVDYNNDFTYDYFAVKTLFSIYLTKCDGKIAERPQQMLLRVALGLWKDNIALVEETYRALSNKLYTHASPTIFNSGMQNAQLSSCFLLGVHDSVEGIFRSFTQTAMISKFAGGIGVAWHDIRGVGAKIKGTNGISDGIIPFLKVKNDVMRAVNQGGRRAGSAAVYLEPSHPDILAFLRAKRNHGAEEERARDLFYALWIPDLFFKRVIAGGTWSLFDPSECPGLSDVYGEEYDVLYNRYEQEHRYTSQMSAVTLFEQVIVSMIETGTPYLLAKDTCNEKSNQKNVGTIKCSNLCVSGDTVILTERGHLPIQSLVNQNVDVWNGQEFSNVTVRKTGVNQEMVRVQFSNGMTLDCTPYHKFKVQSSCSSRQPLEVQARDLQRGAMLAKCKFPIIEHGEEWKEAYTHGFFCGDGFYHADGTPGAWLYGEKHNLQQHLSFVSAGRYCQETSRSYVRFDKSLPAKYTVPINCNLDTKLKWLAGWLDADGCQLQAGSVAVQASSVHKEFLREVKLLLQSLGVDAHMSIMRDRILPDGQALNHCYRICINNTDVNHLMRLGLATKRLALSDLHVPDRCAGRYVKVVSVTPLVERMDTFCFTEPKQNTGIFGGIYCCNCAEIVEYSSPEEIAVCTLSSISLPAFVKSETDGKPWFDHKSLHETAKLVTKNLNRVIDVGFLPVHEARVSNSKHRPVGIGTQGLADTFALLRIPFDSSAALSLNSDIAETLYHAAIETSVELAKQSGPYETFQGSPASQGLLQFDLWKVRPTTRYDWTELKNKVLQHGLRNSLLIAHMPTASTSQLLNNTETNEPFTSMIFKRQTLSGEHVVVNRHLVADLMKLGLWSVDIKDSIVANDGSVQHLRGLVPTEILDLYKTVWEIKQRTIIDMAAARGPYVCQSQSMNLYFESPTTVKFSSAIIHAWKSGLKTLVYYSRTKAAARAVPVTLTECQSCTA